MADSASRAEIRKLKLNLLTSIEPLLSPTLPPTPPLSNDDEDVHPSPLPAPKSILKRKLDGGSSPASVHGLGLLNGAADGDIKRQKLSPTSKPSPLLNRTPVIGSDSRPPTPDLRASHFPPAKSERPLPPSSPLIGGARSVDWRASFPKERLLKLGDLYRTKGRDLKHKGDRLSRDSASSRITALPLVLQTEALIFYVFSFWCDDQAARHCLPQNWGSIFGLLKFVKAGAEKSGYPLLTAICLRLEAHIIHALSIHEQKNLNYKGVQLIQAPPSSSSLSAAATNADKHSPSSQGSPDSLKPDAIPPSGHSPPPPSAPTSFDLVKQFTKAGNQLFSWPRLWEEAGVALGPPVLSATLPNTWRNCIESAPMVESSSCVLPTKPWRFAWPMDLNRTMSVPHSISFLRSILEEWALKEGLEYLPVAVSEEV